MDLQNNYKHSSGINIDWSDAFTLDLIKAMEKTECLWKFSRVGQGKLNARNTSWNTIADQLQITKKEAVYKWKVLRSTYRNPSLSPYSYKRSFEPASFRSFTPERSEELMLTDNCTPTSLSITNKAQEHELKMSAPDAMANVTKPERDLWDSYGDYVAASARELENVYPDWAMKLKIEIQQLIQKQQHMALERMFQREAV